MTEATTTSSKPAAAPADKKTDTYKVLIGMNYPPGKRAEKGDKVTDLPAKSIPWLLERGYIKKEVK